MIIFCFPGSLASPGSPDRLVLAWVSLATNSAPGSPHLSNMLCNFLLTVLLPLSSILEEVCPSAFLISVLDRVWLEEYSVRIPFLEVY